MKEQDTECHCSRTSRYHHKDSTYNNHSVQRCWTNMPDTNKPPTLVAIGEGNVNKPTNTPDTEWTEAPEEIRSKCQSISGENDINDDDEVLYIYNWKQINTATDIAYQAGVSSRDTYWKERVRKEPTVIEESLIEIAKMLANGSAFSKESGLIWQHVIDEAKRLCLLRDAVQASNQSELEQPITNEDNLK